MAKLSSNLIAFVIKDEKTHGFSTPSFLPSLPDITRQLTAAVRQNPQLLFAQFPADYSVWAIGEWDPHSGVMELYMEKEFLFHMVDVAGKQQKEGQ